MGQLLWDLVNSTLKPTKWNISTVSAETMQSLRYNTKTV